jgi:hypothetical protein
MRHKCRHVSFDLIQFSVSAHARFVVATKALTLKVHQTSINVPK